MKILLYDLETRPALVRTFSLFKPVIGHGQIIEDARVMCWSAMWLGGKKVMFQSEHHSSRKEMLEELHALMDEADVVVGYNSKRFDTPWIMGEFISEGMSPPSPFKEIDLFQVIRSNTRFISKKLDFVASKLLGDRKVEHQGFDLWLKCIDGDEKAWTKMRTYAKKDTALLEPLYLALRPYIKNHPNVPLHNLQSTGCTRCGGVNLQRRGYHHTGASTFQRYRCNDCGAWGHYAMRLGTSDTRS